MADVQLGQMLHKATEEAVTSENPLDVRVSNVDAEGNVLVKQTGNIATGGAVRTTTRYSDLTFPVSTIETILEVIVPSIIDCLAFTSQDAGAIVRYWVDIRSSVGTYTSIGSFITGTIPFSNVNQRGHHIFEVVAGADATYNTLRAKDALVMPHGFRLRCQNTSVSETQVIQALIEHRELTA